jgi:hypothetical protein
MKKTKEFYIKNYFKGFFKIYKNVMLTTAILKYFSKNNIGASRILSKL